MRHLLLARFHWWHHPGSQKRWSGLWPIAIKSPHIAKHNQPIYQMGSSRFYLNLVQAHRVSHAVRTHFVTINTKQWGSINPMLFFEDFQNPLLLSPLFVYLVHAFRTTPTPFEDDGICGCLLEFIKSVFWPKGVGIEKLPFSCDIIWCNVLHFSVFYDHIKKTEK